MERITSRLQSMSLQEQRMNLYKQTNAFLVKQMKDLNQRVDELKELETTWETTYNDLYKEYLALKQSPELLCVNCQLLRALTPEGKTFQPCAECGETREHLRKQVNYWKSLYERVTQDDCRSGYDTFR